MISRSTSDSDFFTDALKWPTRKFLTNFFFFDPNWVVLCSKNYPSTSLMKVPLDEFETDRSIHLHIKDILLQVKAALQKERIFDGFMKKRILGNQIWEWHSTEEALGYITHGNSLLNSLFSNWDSYIKNPKAYNSNGLYGHKTITSHEFDFQWVYINFPLVSAIKKRVMRLAMDI